MTIRMDNEIKQQAQSLFADLGLDMSTAINLFLRQALQCRGLPFSIQLNRQFNKTTVEAINCADNMELNGPFSSVSELMDSLNDS